MAAESPGSEQIRTAEMIAALCLGTDLGMGFPFEHGLHATLIAMRLADRLGIDVDVLPGGHLLALSRPGELADRLEDYLESLRR